MLRPGFIVAILVGLTLAGCGSNSDATTGKTSKPVFLDSSASRSSTVTALDHQFCRKGHIRTIEDAAPYWVGLCRDRTTFEQPVFFMVFNTEQEMRFYLQHYESCIADGHYEQGPAWFAMTMLPSDAHTLKRAGAAPLSCP